MKAARVHQFGTELQVDDVSDPVPSEGEHLVDLSVISVNPLDLWVAEGAVAGGGQQLPFTVGVEAVGIYDGQTVMVNGAGLGVSRPGVYAERVAAPVAALADVPNGVQPAQASAVSVAGVTAYRILNRAALANGELIVILGASGGVGSITIQLALARGARVVAVTTREEKVAELRDLGATDVLLSDGTSFERVLRARHGQGADVLVNPLGATYTELGIEALEPGGRQILLGRSAGNEMSFQADAFYRKNVSLLGYGGLVDSLESREEAKAAVLRALADGSLTIPIAREYSLTEAQAAFDLIRRHEAVGRVLIYPSG